MAVGFILGSSPKCMCITIALFRIALLILFSTHVTNLIVSIGNLITIDAALASEIWEERLNKSNWTILSFDVHLEKLNHPVWNYLIDLSEWVLVIVGMDVSLAEPTSFLISLISSNISMLDCGPCPSLPPPPVIFSFLFTFYPCLINIEMLLFLFIGKRNTICTCLWA